MHVVIIEKKVSIDELFNFDDCTLPIDRISKFLRMLKLDLQHKKNCLHGDGLTMIEERYLKEIEFNQINKKIASLSQEILREKNILKGLKEEKIKRFNIELLTAKAAKIDDIDFEKISVMYENINLLNIEKTSGVSKIFPLWYLLGEDFITRELQQLKSESVINTTSLIEMNALISYLESYKYTIDSNVSAVDISWSMIPTTPVGPNKRLSMVIVLSIAFLFSVFFYYVFEIFRSPKR